MSRPVISFWLAVSLLVFALLGGTALMHQNSVQTFGAVSGLPEAGLPPRPDGLAINLALDQAADPDRVLETLTAFHWLRQVFPWDEIEPTPQAYQWEKWDALVPTARAHAKQWIAVLNGSPAWARAAQPGRPAPPDTPETFAAFAGAFAARYAADIDVYQIWDEPNLKSGWGGAPPSAAAYAALLQKAYTAIHAADPTATVIAAALAPTTETGPDNYSDLLYLQQLYDLGAGAYFDAAAGKPYGFYTGPDDRQVSPQVLNFSRFTLLRQVMERNGDGHKLLWAGNFGWNTQASPWGQATPAQQIDYTLAAYTRAQNEWPWAGPLALETYQPAAPASDPHWGFALADPAGQLTPLGLALNTQAAATPIALPGQHLAQDPAAQYFGEWKFSELGADVYEASYAAARLQITFVGTDLALKVRRGDYRAYLYVEIDGQPANALPRAERGAYLVLTSPDRTPQVNSVPVATGLAPDQLHTAVIYPERGWDQWALAGFVVGHTRSNQLFSFLLGGLALLALLGAGGVWRFGRQINWASLAPPLAAFWKKLGDPGQFGLTLFTGALLGLSTWLTFADDWLSVARRSGDTVPLLLTVLTAGLFYFSPSVVLAGLALAVLFILFYLRPDLALALAAFFIPFYLKPKVLWQHGFALVEVITLMALALWLLSQLRDRLRATPNPAALVKQLTTGWTWSRLLSPAVALLVVAALSLVTAELKGVALREFRLVIFAPLVFYFLLRYTALDQKAWWRIVDFFILGAVAVAAIGLWQYLTHTDLITAEGGVLRIRSVYGSPNNLALYLGRAWPIALAVALRGQNRLRRAGYGLAILVMSAALLLTFSKGALLLGLPAALAVILIGGWGKRGWVTVGLGGMAAVGALPFLSRVPRFANLLNPQSGTSFFRVKVWLSAWRMFLDRPVLGVGLDNFLYQYRSKYILPEAWEEPDLSHPHNMVLDFLSRLGLLGLICGGWLQVAFWRAAVGAYHRLKADRDLQALCLGLMASVADMLAHGLVDNSFFLLDLAYAFFLVLAAAQWLRARGTPSSLA